MPKTDYHIVKRRYLNKARIAFSDPDMLQEFALNFKQRDFYDPNTFPLRHSISKLFHLTEKLSFRQNATQIFRDILEGLVYHNSDKGKIINHVLFATDIDHKVMTDMAEIVLSPKNVRIIPIAHLLLKNSSLSRNNITNYFVEEAIKSKATIILIPHVNWVNGAILDVLTICKALKVHNSKIITIVDGAQALGNIETEIDNHICNLNIDFYVGCGQKWMGCPLPIGFARVSDKFIERKKFSKFIFTCDYFSEFAGNEGFLDQPALDTYNIHFSILFDTVVKKFQDGRGEIKKHHYSDIIKNAKPLVEIIKGSGMFELLNSPENMQSGIITLTGEYELLQKLNTKLLELYFSHTLDKIRLPKDKKLRFDFIRFSSPMDTFNSNDLDKIESTFKNLR